MSAFFHKFYLNFIEGHLFSKLLWAIIFAEIILIFLYSLNVTFNVDEVESLHASWRILSGQRIYVDFFEHHHPLFYYTLIPIAGLFKESIMMIIAARFFVFLMLLLIFVVTYKISKIVFGKESALIGLVFLGSTKYFVERAVEVRPDVPQALFGLWAVYLLLTYFNNKSLRYLILSSASLAISFLFLQKSIFLAFISGLLLCHAAYCAQIKLRDVILYCIVFIVAVMPYYLHLFFNGQFHDYLLYAWDLNIDLFKQYSGWGRDTMSTLMYSFKVNFLLWVFWLLSLLFLDTPNKERVGVCSLFLLIVYISMQLHWTQYLTLVLPLIAIMAGYALHKVMGLFLKRQVFLLWGMAAIYIFSLIFFYSKEMKAFQNTRQLMEMEYVLHITKPTDYVYDGKLSFNLCRKDLDFFWFLQKKMRVLSTVKEKAANSYDIYKLIDQYKPKVISKAQISNMNDPRISEHYQRSVIYPDLYLRIN